MALEIERRFLVRGCAWRDHVRWSEALHQGYLAASAEGITVRVRTAPGDRAWLTLKAPTAAAAVRQEFEYPIPITDAEALLLLAPCQLRKRRHGLDLAGGAWVVDEFEGANAPLVVAEVELEAADGELALPHWCVLELTGRSELSNAALSRRPFAHWSEAEQQDLLQALAAVPGPDGSGA